MSNPIMINGPWNIGPLVLPHRLIQGPLAGYSCAPFRKLFYEFKPPAFCVTEMISALDVLNTHKNHARYLYRAPEEKILAYQISGNDADILAEAALFLQGLGADMIDINCGCPKAKVRKKGAGSALVEEPQKLLGIIKKVRKTIQVPLTIKIRIQGNDEDLTLAKSIADAGADALIVHGRRWTEDYDVPCNFSQIARIKASISIPVIANGDISTRENLQQALALSHCDAFMISRAGSGQPWLFQELLDGQPLNPSLPRKIKLFVQHLQELALLEDAHKAVLQSKSLVRYYFRKELSSACLKSFYALQSIPAIEGFFLTMVQGLAHDQ